MSFVLFEDEKELGEVSNWGYTPEQKVFKDVMGEQVLVGINPAQCVFKSPVPLKAMGTYSIVFEGKVRYNLKITQIQNNVNASAIIESKENVQLKQ